MARKTHLDVATVSLFGTDYHKKFDNMSIETNDTEQDGRGVAERYADHVPTKTASRISFNMFQTVSTIRQSMLDMTILTYDGSDILGNCRSGRMAVNTQTDDGEGGGDQFIFPFACGTDITVEAQLQVVANAAFQSIMRGPIDDRRVLMAVSTPGFEFSIPIVLLGATHGVQVGRIQTENIRLGLRNGSISGVTGDTLLTSLFTGTCIGAGSIDTGDDEYTFSSMLAMSGGLEWSSGALIMSPISFMAQGDFTLA